MDYGREIGRGMIAIVVIGVLIGLCVGCGAGWLWRNNNPPTFQHSSLVNCPAGSIPWLDMPRLDRRPEIVCREVEYYG